MEAIRKTNAVNYRFMYYNERKSQFDMVVEYMKHYGSITSDEALEACGVRRLAAVMFNIRRVMDVYSYRDPYEKISIYSLDEKQLKKAIDRRQKKHGY